MYGPNQSDQLANSSLSMRSLWASLRDRNSCRANSTHVHAAIKAISCDRSTAGGFGGREWSSVSFVLTWGLTCILTSFRCDWHTKKARYLLSSLSSRQRHLGCCKSVGDLIAVRCLTVLFPAFPVFYVLSRSAYHVRYTFWSCTGGYKCLRPW